MKDRFKFGKNWEKYIDVVDSRRIDAAKRSLTEALGRESLEGLRFLDVGSGSGLFSLAAQQLGATVHSFDYDELSVRCTDELKRRFSQDNDKWTIERGSVLDNDYFGKLNVFDIVYAWGVLHHTGAMWEAMKSVADAVGPGGLLFVAIYNDQGVVSRYWRFVKRVFNSSVFGRAVTIVLHAPYLFGARWLFRRALRRPIERGMDLWTDMVDWLGGYPFEVATPREVVEFYAKEGFLLQAIRTCGNRHGCNEYVFRRVMDGSSASEVYDPPAVRLPLTS
jgi:2-polyprenyl-3-methyl-5-hydroxy-6-metoxy-1,4-benzoquinol methylase